MATPIVFIHGMFVTPHCWAPWVERFSAKGHHCIAPAWPHHDGEPRSLREKHPDPALGKVTLEDVVSVYCDAIARCENSPILIGHSMGGLIVQILLQRGLGAAGVAIDSAPPKGVFVPSWSFLKSNLPVVSPLASLDEPYLMPFEHFVYTFVHTLAPEDQRNAYESSVVPESRRVAKDSTQPVAAIDFTRPHVPLLFIAGSDDKIIPAKLNRANFARYPSDGSITELRELPGRTHYLIADAGWTQVADEVSGFIERHKL